MPKSIFLQFTTCSNDLFSKKVIIIDGLWLLVVCFTIMYTRYLRIYEPGCQLDNNKTIFYSMGTSHNHILKLWSLQQLSDTSRLAESTIKFFTFNKSVRLIEFRFSEKNSSWRSQINSILTKKNNISRLYLKLQIERVNWNKTWIILSVYFAFHCPTVLRKIIVQLLNNVYYAKWQ